MLIKGTIEEIIFYNKLNGYTVVQVDCDGLLYTCVGNMPEMSVGEGVELEGDISVHHKYGEQFVVRSFTAHAPTGRESVIRFLSSGLIKGIGEKTAKKIYDAFGARSMEIIENEPAKLTEIKGISQSKAEIMAQCYIESKKMQQQIVYLQNYNISLNMAIKIYNIYKEKTIEIVKNNTYKLIDDIDGIGFFTADRIARSMGHDENSPFRYRAAIIYTLKNSGDKHGNTYLEYDELSRETAAILRVENIGGIFDEVIDRLVLDTVIKDFTREGKRHIALTKYYNTENKIAAALVRFAANNGEDCPDVSVLIKDFEREKDICLHLNQIEAVKAAVTKGVTVITGGPGTGKTTIVNCIEYIFRHQKVRTEYCSPTGRAAKRLSQSIGKEAMTVHRLLGMNAGEGQINFAYNQYNQLNCGAVVIDEVSMMDAMLMHYLLRALPGGTKVILVGDKDQLPSVGAGNVLADIIHSDIIHVVYLTQIYRQTEDSRIVTNAHIINGGKMPVIDNRSSDFFMIDQAPDAGMADTVVRLVTERLPAYCGVSGAEIQVLGPLKSGAAGIENLNRKIQSKLNPPSSGKKEIRVGETVFREGDRVMQIANDYQMTWTRLDDKGLVQKGEGVFNGDIGFIDNINAFSGAAEIVFDDNRRAEYSVIDLYNVQLAYAITIHKSQGSEFDVLVIALTNGPPTIINKNLLYTAVTRAKRTVVLVTTKKILAMTVRNNYIAERKTMLKAFLKDEKEKYDSLFS